MTKKEVTVVIPAYNREQYIEKAIRSVLEQTYKKWHLIIVNDGSTDRTGGVIERYTRGNAIQHMKLAKNLGIGKALQTALKEIQTPYFMILDSDDWVEPNALQVLVKEMENQPKTTSLVCANSKIWQDNNGTIRNVDLLKNRSFKDKYDFLRYGPAIYPRFMRTSAVRQVGGFENDDPQGGSFDEDRYLLLKLIGMSDFHWVDKNLYNVRVHRGNITRPENRPYFNEVKKYIFTKILKQWGDEYKPIFAIAKDGWLYIKELEPKKKGDNRK